MANDNTDSKPVLVVTNSNVQHNLGDSEYPRRVEQCRHATERLAKLDSNIHTLRDVTLEEISVATSQELLEGILLQRSRHVVSENKRTEDTASALENGEWSQVGQLMNQSHTSMRDDYEVSCKEIDVLVELAQGFEGVYGSRLTGKYVGNGWNVILSFCTVISSEFCIVCTGGGFGGCTVTLVKENVSQQFIKYLEEQYKEKAGLDCVCFETSPSEGAREL
jgi:galactokinase